VSRDAGMHRGRGGKLDTKGGGKRGEQLIPEHYQMWQESLGGSSPKLNREEVNNPSQNKGGGKLLVRGGKWKKGENRKRGTARGGWGGNTNGESKKLPANKLVRATKL